MKEQDRSRADGLLWKQDTQWARILDEGWDLGRVKQAKSALCCSLTPLLFALSSGVGGGGSWTNQCGQASSCRIVWLVEE